MKKAVILCMLFLGFITLVEAQKLKPFKASNGKWGFKNSSGVTIVKPKYDTCLKFWQGLAAVNIGGEDENALWGFINETGELITPIKYSHRYFEGYFLTNGMIVVGVEIKDTSDAEYPKSYVKFGAIDKTGKEVVPLKYDWINNFTKDGYAIMQLNEKKGVINRKGEIVVPPNYETVSYFKEGLAVVMTFDKKFGFVNTLGKEVVKPIYNHAYGFSEGLAAVKLNNKWGYIDKTGKVVIPIEYDDAESFKSGKAKVQLNKQTFYINNKGEGIE